MEQAAKERESASLDWDVPFFFCRVSLRVIVPTRARDFFDLDDTSTSRETVSSPHRPKLSRVKNHHKNQEWTVLPSIAFPLPSSELQRLYNNVLFVFTLFPDQMKRKNKSQLVEMDSISWYGGYGNRRVSKERRALISQPTRGCLSDALASELMALISMHEKTMASNWKRKK